LHIWCVIEIFQDVSNAFFTSINGFVQAATMAAFSAKGKNAALTCRYNRIPAVAGHG
jgi:hypothetical protein